MRSEPGLGNVTFVVLAVFLNYIYIYIGVMVVGVVVAVVVVICLIDLFSSLGKG